MDELDRNIIGLLSADARVSVATLSRRLKVARSTIQARLERLETSGVIAGYTVKLGEAARQGRIRATVAGWETVAGVAGAVIGLTSFGVLADLTGGFAAAARWIGLIVAIVAIGFTWLPETRGTELATVDGDDAGAAPDDGQR